MTNVASFMQEFDRHRLLVKRAIETLTDKQYFRRPAEHANSIALIVKHLPGNLSSRTINFGKKQSQRVPRLHRQAKIARIQALPGPTRRPANTIPSRNPRGTSHG